MSDLVELALRFGFLLLCSPFLLGVVCALTALYGLGSNWPMWAPVLLGVLTPLLWGYALWRLIRT
ncbi:hypothetical protein [Deinococcus sonorensis]|uniref:Uncharacterized protein n=2 Tax=Deinococcus sonorensis TaxID=309891 RepID=A0AAU7UFQ4_9DEIO